VATPTILSPATALAWATAVPKSWTKMVDESSRGQPPGTLCVTTNVGTPIGLGRQEDWEQPPGRSDGPMLHWLRRHDDYGS
jgi:hypothetical protein